MCQLRPRRSSAGTHIPSFVLLTLVLGCNAALNVGTGAAESMVSQLRRSIFVDTAYLAEREEHRCSSLGGPKCLLFALAGQRPDSPELDGPGVVPEQMLHDLAVQHGDLDFITPTYQELEGLRRKLTTSSEEQALMSTDDAAAFRASRRGAEHGALHFGDLLPDQRVPLSFSRGLPDGVVATWDGKWIVRSCLEAGDRAGLEGPLALPAPHSRLPADPHLPVVLPSAQALSRSSDGKPATTSVSAAAELAGHVGYLRFSRPVVVRSLFARWAPEAAAPPAVVAGRLGLEGAWASHLAPRRLRRGQWLDVSAGSLAPVDELAFLAAPGLELGALWTVAHSDDFADGGNERTVMLLEPVFNTSLTADFSRPRFGVKAQRVSPAATPFLVSLQEAVERGLRLHLEPSTWAAPHSHGVAANYPALLTTESAAVGRWTPAALANQMVLDHGLPVGGGWPGTAERLAVALRQLAPRLPEGLQRELEREEEAILDALRTWASAGGKWSHTDPSSFPVNGSELAVQRYIQAKRLQSRLDLVTAAFLHLRPQMQQQQQRPRMQGGPWA